MSQYTVQCYEYWWTAILNIGNLYPWAYYSQCYTGLFAFSLAFDLSIIAFMI